MSKREILEELPKLTPQDRREIAVRIQEMESAELTEEEKRILDRELEDYERSPDAGSTWEEVETRIRSSRRP